MLPQIAEQMNIPILGICGGHQALALAFGGKVGPIRAGEDDCMPYTRDRQGGVIPLKVTTQDPLFEGLQDKIRIVASHFDEVKVLPPGFVLLASDKVSPNQIMRHPTKPVYGIQGHPEYFSSHRPDTGIILKNFMKIVESYTLGKPKQPLVSLPTPGSENTSN
jgi:GMP synthase (glutamine-hydrolysing)